jgi:hypothetical protein
MSDPIQALEQRVAALEKEVAELRNLLGLGSASPPSPEDPWMKSPVLREMRLRQLAEQPVLDAIIARHYGELLARVKPIGAEALQAMQQPLENRGPEWKTASQEIVEMREE